MRALGHALASLAFAVLGQAQESSFVIVLLDDVGLDFLALYDERNPYRRDLPYQPQLTGTGDVPGNGHGSSNLYAHTPTLDALAAGGVLFLDAYAQPMCSPTRASLLTGCHPLRTGVGDVLDPGHLGALRELNDPGFELRTLPELVRLAGLTDAIFGKWHLGMQTLDMGPGPFSACDSGWASIPQRGGFTHWSCIFNGVDSVPRPAPVAGYYSFYVNRGFTDHADVVANGLVQGVHATVLQTQEALAWCNAQSGPFLCYLSLNAAHAPWHELPPIDAVHTEEFLSGPVNAFTRYMAMLEATDTALGEFLDGLDPAVRASTHILVLGDNGTPEPVLEHARSLATPDGSTGGAKALGQTYDLLLGGPSLGDGRFKSTVYERGIRVPLIVSGPSIANPGRASRALVQVEDVFATIAEILSLDPGPVDGISFGPVLRDEVDALDHQRQSTWSERFRPTGPAGPGSPLDLRLVGYSLRIPGAGRFKLVRQEPALADELYQLEDAEGEPVDPWETEPLAHGPEDAWHETWLILSAAIELMLARGTESQALVSTQVYCGAASNSTGSAARLTSRGTLSIGRSDFVPMVDGVRPGQFGILFHGPGMMEMPFGDGALCVAPPVVRSEPMQMPFRGPLCVSFPLAPGIQPDTTRYLQFWYRDPGGPGGSGFNLSNALSASFLP